MNIFLQSHIAQSYDDYYQTELGKAIDTIESKIVKELISLVPKGELLELGCGTGHWTQFFIQLGFDVTGVDASEAMLNLAKRKKFPARLQLASVDDLPFNDAQFKTAASITMLEFVEDQSKAIREMCRVLQPSGYLLMGCLNGNSVLGKNPANDEVFKCAKFLTPDEVQELFIGFRLVKMNFGVYLDESFQLLDDQKYSGGVEPVFMGILLQKI